VEKVMVNGAEFLSVDTAGLRLLTSTAMVDIAHLLRPAHLASLAKILKDPGTQFVVVVVVVVLSVPWITCYPPLRGLGKFL